jgi:predicted acetyltransferase
MDFKFNSYENLTDGEIELVLREKQQAPPGKGFVPQYHFDICLAGKKHTPAGKIRLRVGKTKRVTTYAGNIGFEIDEVYRGHRFAAKACYLIKKVASDHRMKTCWLTCRPDNLPSKRTCEIIGAKFVEIVDIPEDYDIYKKGNKQMCRYRWDLRPQQRKAPL